MFYSKFPQSSCFRFCHLRVYEFHKLKRMKTSAAAMLLLFSAGFSSSQIKLIYSLKNSHMQKTHFDWSMEFYTECAILHTMWISFSKMEIKDSRQIFTTAPIFLQFNYFRLSESKKLKLSVRTALLYVLITT